MEDEDDSLDVEELSWVLGDLPLDMRGRILQSARSRRSASSQNRIEVEGMMNDTPEPGEDMADLVGAMRPTIQRRSCHTLKP